MVRARGGFSALLVVFALAFVLGACGEPELSDEARETEGSGDPTGSSGSPVPGLPPALPSGVPPG